MTLFSVWCMVVLLCCCCCSSVYSLTQAEMDAIDAHSVNVTQTLISRRRGKVVYLSYESKAVPNYETPFYDQINQDNLLTFKVNMNPVWRETPICLHSGPIAMTYIGVPLLRPYTSRGVDAVEAEYTKFDDCEGHTSPSGRYHYHGPIKCLVNANEIDQFIGVAYDGYPIYGPYDANGEVTKDDLDQCQGRHETVGGETVYRYRMTNSFPYSLGCYHGELFDPTMSEDDKCLFPNNCGPNPGLIEPDEDLYLECGGGHWSTGKGGKRRQLIENKLDSLQKQAKLTARELYNEIQVEKDQEEKEQQEGKRAYEAQVEMRRRELKLARSLKATKRTNVRSSAVRQQMESNNNSVERKSDVSANTLRSLIALAKQMLKHDEK